MERSFVLTELLCIFGGTFGLHRFYTGYIGIGITYLLTFGLLGVGVIWDLKNIIAGDFVDINEEALDGYSPMVAYGILITVSVIALALYLQRVAPEIGSGHLIRV